MNNIGASLDGLCLRSGNLFIAEAYQIDIDFSRFNILKLPGVCQNQ